MVRVTNADRVPSPTKTGYVMRLEFRYTAAPGVAEYSVSPLPPCEGGRGGSLPPGFLETNRSPLDFGKETFKTQAFGKKD